MTVIIFALRLSAFIAAVFFIVVGVRSAAEWIARRLER